MRSTSALAHAAFCAAPTSRQTARHLPPMGSPRTAEHRVLLRARSTGSVFPCGFKGSTQRFRSWTSWSGAHEATSTDLLFLWAARRDLGPLEGGRDAACHRAGVRSRRLLDRRAARTGKAPRRRARRRTREHDADLVYGGEFAPRAAADVFHVRFGRLVRHGIPSHLRSPKGYDEPEFLRSRAPSICLEAADGGRKP